MNIRYLAFIAVFFINMMFFKKFGGSFFNFIPTTILLLVILFSSFLYYLKENIKPVFSSNHLVVLSFIIFMFFGLLWTDSFFYGIQKVLTLFATVIFFYLLTPIFYKKFKLFIIIMIVFYILYLINLYISYGSITELSSMLERNFRLGWDDKDSTLFHPIGIARYLTLSIIALYFFYILTRNNVNRLLLLICTSILFVFGLVYLFFSGTRTPILAIVLSVLFYYLFNTNTKSHIKVMIVLIPFLAIFSLKVVTTFKLGLEESQINYIEYRFFDTSSALDDRSFQRERAYSLIDGGNLLFGSGTGNFSYVYNKSDIRDYPHNIIAEIIYENGLINILLLGYMIFNIIKLNLRNSFIETQYFIILFYFFFINSFFSGDLISNNLLFGFYIVLSGASYFNQKLILNKE